MTVVKVYFMTYSSLPSYCGEITDPDIYYYTSKTIPSPSAKLYLGQSQKPRVREMRAADGLQ